MSFLGDILKWPGWDPLSKILGIFNVFYTLVSPARIRVKLPKFTIPAEDLEMLSRQIQANTAISDEARKIAIEALKAYNEGRLSPTYEALYNEYARRRRSQVLQELAARGFVEGSTEYNRAIADLLMELDAYKARLLEQQLTDAMNATGLSETTQRELYSKWSAMSDIYRTQLARQELELQRKIAEQELQAQRVAGAMVTLKDILAPPEEKKPKPMEERPREITPTETIEG